jgi:hypothetical protein
MCGSAGTTTSASPCPGPAPTPPSLAHARAAAVSPLAPPGHPRPGTLRHPAGEWCPCGRHHAAAPGPAGTSPLTPQPFCEAASSAAATPVTERVRCCMLVTGNSRPGVPGRSRGVELRGGPRPALKYFSSCPVYLTSCNVNNEAEDATRTTICYQSDYEIQYLFIYSLWWDS